MSHALGKTLPDRIVGYRDNRDLRGLALEIRSAWIDDINDIRIAANDLLCQGGCVRLVLFPSVALNRQVLALDVAEVPELGQKHRDIVAAVLLHP